MTQQLDYIRNMPARSMHPVLATLVYLATRFAALIGALLLLLMLWGIWTGGSQMMGVPSIALWIILLSMFAMHLQNLRRRRARMILHQIAAAITVRLPLPSYLRAAAESESSPMRKRLIRLAGGIEAGLPVGTAFGNATGGVMPRVAGQLDAAQSCGDLEPTLARLTDTREEALLTAHSTRPFAYILSVVVATNTVFFIIAIFVIPKFAEIFRDFNLKLPRVTLLMLDYLPMLLPVVALVFLVTAVVIVSHNARVIVWPREDRNWYRGIVDRLAWYTPFFGRMTRDRNYADLCAGLAAAFRAGFTFDHAATLQAGAGLNAVLTNRLLRVVEMVRRGESNPAAAVQAKLPALVVSLLKQDTGGDLAGAMTFAHHAYAARFDRMVVLLRAVMPVLLTMVFGALVLFVVLGLFMPMVSLINGTSSTIQVGL
jgi:type II secretory pathway component PulF